MDIAVLTALVVAAVQALKAKIPFIPPVILAIVISLIVVAVKAFESGVTFNLALAWLWIQVLLAAIGSFKVLNAATSGRLSVPK